MECDRLRRGSNPAAGIEGVRAIGALAAEGHQPRREGFFSHLHNVLIQKGVPNSLDQRLVNLVRKCFHRNPIG